MLACRLTLSAFLRAVLASALCLLASHSAFADEPLRFARHYVTEGAPHLKILTLYGNVTVAAWSRHEVSVRAFGAGYATVRDRVMGAAIMISVRVSVKPAPKLERVDLEISVPADTSLQIVNRKGEVKIRGLAGHIKVDSGDGDITLSESRSSSIDARVICGDILFDGSLEGGGPYVFGSIRGDIHLTLPATESFRLSVRSLTEQIDFGGFAFDSIVRRPKFISGQHNHDGPMLQVVAFNGRIALRKR